MYQQPTGSLSACKILTSILAVKIEPFAVPVSKIEPYFMNYGSHLAPLLN